MSGSMSFSVNSNTTTSLEEIDVNISLWKYVTVIRKGGKKGGNVM